jgi:excisionase family DNA binding protein
VSASTPLSIRDVATECRVSTKTVRRWIASGRLPAVKRGRHVHIASDELAAFRGQVDSQPVDRGHGGQDTGDSEDRPEDTSSGQAVLLELVRDLQRQVIEKAEAAAMWQARAQLLAEQLALPPPQSPRIATAPWWQRWALLAAAVAALAAVLGVLGLRTSLGL